MKKLLSVIAAILFAATTFAQVDEVTLTTIGTGRNEDEATLRALRSALEQSFGTFVSENTTIINDELVRDEIASTSKGVADAVYNVMTPVLTSLVVAINKMNSGNGQALYVEGVSDGDIVRITTDANEKFKKTNGRPLYA